MDHLVSNATSWMEEIKQSSNKSVTFIGVHCRRTDFENHLKTVSGCTEDNNVEQIQWNDDF